ncbi:ABC transporter permease [Ruegeria atlantica]|uniref:ABC transporter permease n=1 Tax=Ruegeria atlantica TaxID=81569 RepID=UPI00147CFC17|nr:ABC transporter permease [Ruegeria atlantica]
MARLFKVEKRPELGFLGLVTQAVVAIILAFLASAVLLEALGFNAAESFEALRIGAIGDWESFQGTLIEATPLVFTGLAAGLAFRAKIWSIGQEGQLFAGSMMAYLLTTMVELPPVLMVTAVLVAGMVGGALMGGLAGVLKARFNVDEIVSTVMLNYIIIYLLSYLLTSRLWMAPGEYYLQTAQVPEASRLPLLPIGDNLHLGVGLAVLAVILVHFVLSRTTFGYELRAFGENKTAARYKGTNPKRMTVIVLMLSGALAGLGGVGQTFGVDFRITQNFLVGLGSAGIIIAVIAGLRPIMIGLVALLFGGLANGGLFMQVMADVSSAIISAMQAIVLIFFLGSSVLFQYRLKRVTSNE